MFLILSQIMMLIYKQKILLCNLAWGTFLFIVSLQDINMKKAFKSSTIQDQQVVSKNSIPNPVADIYNQSDKPPPLNILTPYRYGSLPASPHLCSGGGWMLRQRQKCANVLGGATLGGSFGLKRTF